MNKIFEKILDRLEEVENRLLNESGDIGCTLGITNMSEYSKQIVQEVAEEYNNGWISVKDRLPDKAGSYLVIGKSGGATVTHWYMPNKLFPEGRFGGNSEDYIRYWMPRPQPPKGE